MSPKIPFLSLFKSRPDKDLGLSNDILNTALPFLWFGEKTNIDFKKGLLPRCQQWEAVMKVFKEEDDTVKIGGGSIFPN